MAQTHVRAWSIKRTSSLPFPSACSKVTLSGASVSLSVTVEVVRAAAAAACGVAHLKRLSNAARIFPEPLYDVGSVRPSVAGSSLSLSAAFCTEIIKMSSGI